MKVVKCYYCGDYIPEEEITDWEICAKCEAREQDEHSWIDDEREDWVLRTLDEDDLVDVSIKFADWSEE